MNDLVEVVYLAGRLGLDDDGWPVIPLLDRLEPQGVLVRVICVDRGNSSNDPRILELPGLGNRWLRALSIHRARLETEFEHPCLLHVLHEEMVEAALAQADLWRLPYIQTVDDFGALNRGLRLSRRWFRRLVVSCPELAAEVVEGLGVPADRVSLIAPGLVPVSTVRRSAGWKIPVVGAAGYPGAGSGFACFLHAARLVLGSRRDAEFLLASQGTDALELRRLAGSLRIADRVSVADFAIVGNRFWSALDVYCQPTLVPSTGRILIRALAEGIPCVATQVRGLNGLIDRGSSGLIVPAGDPEALATAIIEMLDHPEQAAAMGCRGQETIRARFDLQREADLLASLYRRHAVSPPEPGGGMA